MRSYAEQDILPFSILLFQHVGIIDFQNPNLTGPYGKNGHIIKPEKLCVHKRKNWRLCSQYFESVIPEGVYHKIEKILDKSF